MRPPCQAKAGAREAWISRTSASVVAVEPGGEVERVVRAGLAELTAGDLAADPVVAVEPDAGGGDRVGAPGHLEQEVGRTGAREGEPGQPGAGGHGQRRRHVGRAEGDPVASRRGVLGGVLGMIFLNKLPRYSHPVSNVERFRAASSAAFFLCIEASDPRFELEATKKALQCSGAIQVTEVPLES